MLAIAEDDPSPNSRALMATADYYRLTKKRVAEIVEQVRAAVTGWETQARELGARSREIVLMRGVIDADR